MQHRGNILLTGAAGAIGRAVAEVLSAAGERLVLVDRNEGALAELAREHPASVTMCADTSDAAQMARVCGTAADGGLAAVILAAGNEGPVGLLEDIDEEAFDAVMTANVKSVWLGLKYSLPVMKGQRRGSIVALASISGVMASPMLSGYAASKHAVVGLVRAAAREAAPFNVRVNALCPAPVASDMMRRIDATLAAKFPERLGGGADAARLVPMKRYATAVEVASAAAFLCSEASSYCNGATFMVDGGISCR